jgi:hypothetical protein|nr:MAG TPA: Flagellar and Swarming motility protein [Caudoviricetes sp.]
MAKFLEFKNYATKSAVLINKSAIISVSPHHNLPASVLRLRYNKEFNIAESVEEVIAKMKGEDNE